MVLSVLNVKYVLPTGIFRVFSALLLCFCLVSGVGCVHHRVTVVVIGDGKIETDVATETAVDVATEFELLNLAEPAKR